MPYILYNSVSLLECVKITTLDFQGVAKVLLEIS